MPDHKEPMSTHSLSLPIVSLGLGVSEFVHTVGPFAERVASGVVTALCIGVVQWGAVRILERLRGTGGPKGPKKDE